jgi:hypothetical protein
MNVYEPALDYNDNDWDVFSKWITGVLITSDATVTFTKKDSTERVMRCTLRPDALPVHETNTDNPIDFPETKRKDSTDTIAVYDLEANGWRSFTIRAVKRVEFAIDNDDI